MVGRLRIRAAYSLVNTAKFMVEEGLGDLVVFEGVVATPESGDLVFRPLEAGMHLIWKKGAVFTPLQKAVMEEIRRSRRNAEDGS